MTLNNLGTDELNDVKIGSKHLAPGMTVHEFPAVASLPAGASVNVTIGVNFNDTTQQCKFDLVASGRNFAVSIFFTILGPSEKFWHIQSFGSVSFCN